MALELITITADNIHWAFDENFRRIFEELKYKVPVTGKVQLEGDWDFQNTYSIFGVTEDGTHSAKAPA